jgi:hypothetical protein
MNKAMISTKINYAEVGEPISHELAEKMIKDFNDLNPHEAYCFNVGRNIIERILAQPGCVGLRIFKATTVEGNHTLVYGGVDEKGNTILSYPGVYEDGKLGKVEALIGDRLSGLPVW